MDQNVNSCSFPQPAPQNLFYPYWCGNPWLANALNNAPAGTIGSMNQAMPQMTQQNQQPVQQMSAPPNMVPPLKTLYCREIENLSEIVPKEIPMDKEPTLFPLKDRSAIYVKYWDDNFQLQNVKYVPEKLEENNGGNQKEPSEFDKIMERLDRIESMFGSAWNNGTSKKQGQKKEVNGNDVG